nr:arginine-ornithine antiporter [Levilactobacillus wangkuiensis]
MKMSTLSEPESPARPSHGLGLTALISTVISSSIGGGIFALTSDLAVAASPGPALIAWGIVGFGTLMLALSLNNLVTKRPDLEGIFSYAEEGFGKYTGFVSGWGYWISAWMGNVAFATVMMNAVGYFIPLFNSSNKIPSVIVTSIILWLLTLLVNHGIESAAVINSLITVCKLIPLFVFIVIAIILFKGQVFTVNFWGNVQSNVQGAIAPSSIGSQIKSCFIIMMWVFVGIEGATMLSSRANKKSDAGKATLIGLCGLVVIYILASVLPYGYFDRQTLAAMKQPAMVYIFRDMVGSWGGAMISLGLIISTLGSWLSWTMLPAETIRLMSKQELLPKIFSRKNKNGTATISLITSSALIQFFLLTLIFTDRAYQIAYSMCTVAITICYILVAAYQIKFSWHHLQEAGNKLQLWIGIGALLFESTAVYFSGIKYLIFCSIAYIPGSILFLMARKHRTQGGKMLSHKEWAGMAIILGCAVLALISLFNGSLRL